MTPGAGIRDPGAGIGDPGSGIRYNDKTLSERE
jgi:hypothetical protein